MATTIYFRGSRAEVRAILNAVPRVLAGQVPDPTGLARGVQLRGAVALLSQVQQDFLVKSRGGTGRDGVKWPPLQPATIAARRRARSEVAGYRQAKKINPKLTKLAYYGGRVVDMLRDTGRLLRSLTPGIEDRPPGNPDTPITVQPGRLILGNNVPYFATHQNGNRHVPARPVYPVGGRIPDAYMPAILGAMSRGVVMLALFLLRGRR